MYFVCILSSIILHVGLLTRLTLFSPNDNQLDIMHVLLLSAYDTSSHNSWCRGLMQHLPDVQWTYLSLPGRYFSWRIRGNAMTWAYGPERAQLEQSFDLIIATSMVDLATLRGLVPSLGHIPAMVYFHENQFAYPDSPDQHKSLEPKMVNLYSALSAEHLVFNSQYNQTSFLNGVSQLLGQLPDHVPNNIGTLLHEKSMVLPVPLIGATTQANVQASSKPLEVLSLVWNHRWEYDKGPDTLLAVCREIDRRGLPVEVSILGQRFRKLPPALAELERQPAKCIRQFGPLDAREDYLRALDKADVVLSTALHEFQGLAMLEGAQHGCIPLAPNRLAYPEWIKQCHLYPDQLAPQDEALAICDQLELWLEHGLSTPYEITPYLWTTLSDKYRQILRLCGAKGKPNTRV